MQDHVLLSMSEIRLYNGAGGRLIFSKAKAFGEKKKIYHWDCEPLQDRTTHDVLWVYDR